MPSFKKPVVAISMGDPSGIGPEIILKSLAKRPLRQLATYIVVGDLNVLRKHARRTGPQCRNLLKKALIVPQSCQGLKNSFLPESGRVNILDMGNVPMRHFSFGSGRASSGRAAVEYIKTAHDLVKADIAACLVTAPINKASAKKAGFQFPGHTEYLASLSGAKKFVMMLIGGPLKVSLVTRHIPLKTVFRRINSRNIAETIRMTMDSLRTDFNIKRPRIGVAALNPHAGEMEIFGSEEEKIVRPAIQKFRRADVRGPIPADALFYDAYRGRFDAVICLYHDQGLIPLKMIARDSGVNITLGLGFVRTSPDHGTAFDIAGKGRADISSMEAAIKLAVSMVKNRSRKTDDG